MATVATPRSKLAVKILLLGNSGVGKSSLVDHYVHSKFTNTYRTTIGADFATKDVTIDDTTVSMQIWDTAGQERYNSLGVSYYRGADCCVLVFDVTIPETFSALDKWKDEFILHTNHSKETNEIFTVLGNKIDLEDHRKITEDMAREWCMENSDVPYFEVSAKEGTNIDNFFRSIARNAMEKMKTRIKRGHGIMLTDSHSVHRRNSDCCPC
ncbi:ras-related protein rab7-like [Glandiceps talaboti]